MNTLIILAGLPVILIIIYIYKRDKYEKEPLKLILKAFFFGMLVPVAVLGVAYLLKNFVLVDTSYTSQVGKAFYDAFIYAALLEEGFKFLALMLAVWKNEEFNEKFDGIVYAVSVGLGFALIENFLYILPTMDYGAAYTRFFTAVPGHAIDGVIMGYFVGIAKFSDKRNLNLAIGFILAFLAHGFYDFMLMSGLNFLRLLFVPFLIFEYYIAFKLLKSHNETSKFNPKNFQSDDL